MGVFFSNFYNIVDDVNFANIINEEGQGGRTVYRENHPSKKFRENIIKYWTVENRQKQSEKMKLNNPSKLDYVKEKLSKLKKGIKNTDEHNKKKGRSGDLNNSKREDVRKKISESLMGHKVSEETKLKISNTLKNRNK